MKRCKSDDFTSTEEGASPTLCGAKEDTPSVFIVEVKHSDPPGGHSEVNPTSQTPQSAVTRTKPPDLKVLSYDLAFKHDVNGWLKRRGRIPACLRFLFVCFAF